MMYYDLDNLFQNIELLGGKSVGLVRRLSNVEEQDYGNRCCSDSVIGCN
jgi:hypothetical protein